MFGVLEMITKIIRMSTEDLKNVMTNIEARLRETKMSMPEFQKLMNVNSQHVNNWKIRVFPGKLLPKAASVLNMSIDELVTGKKNLTDPASLPAYTLEDAPVCVDHYLLELDGDTIPGYAARSRFLCIPFDEDAQENGKYVVLKKSAAEPAVVCIQQGPKSSRTLLAELVGARRVDHPDYLHRYDAGEILCAIFDVVNDSSLWSRE